MKDFIKYTLATVVGLTLTSILMTIISIVSIAGMVASEKASSPIEENSILRIKLQGAINERGGEPDPMAILQGKENNSLALDVALQALPKAAENEEIKGIYLEGGALSAEPAQLQELRQALLKFKESGKWIVAYADHYTGNSYYLCSVADSIYLNPHGSMEWSGMASQPIFFKGLLEKVGVKMQVFKVGTYKSAVEPFICDEMSDANREQVQSYLSSIWNNMTKEVAASRKIEAEALHSAADSLTSLASAETGVQCGLVDKLCYLSEVKEILKNKVELDEDDNLEFTSLSNVANAETLNEKNEDEIAIYYAYGEIVDQPSKGINQEHQIVGKEMMKDLQELREDDDIKAVVIRVNSPGGSAYASEQIWHEVELLKAKKPVIISMGGLAASGGYYISCGANRIIAEPTTLTGSIGIFGMIPDASELLTQKLGVTFDVVKTNALSDMGSPGRPFNEKESQLLQAHVNKGYELFTSRVADGRQMPQDSVKVIGEGRVWSGEQALAIGLVDEMGNLDDAIHIAAETAKLEKYSISRFPAEQEWFTKLVQKGQSGYMDSQMRTLLGDYYTAFSLISNLKQQNPIQARMPYYLNLK